MNESFIHYLWQFQYFDKSELTTTAGEVLNILKPGILNSDAGPDFSQAKIKIGSINWAGNVEIHIQSSGWYEHTHDQDAAYENVVLHVVWEENKPVYRTDGTRIPTLQLKGRVEDHLLKSYQKLINNPSAIPCEKSFANVDDIIKHAMVDKAVMHRLETKATEIKKLLDKNKGDWVETTYQLVGSNFGFKVNKDPFIQLTNALPYKLIQKHRSSSLEVEALLFGQAGFLVAKTKDEYLTQLFITYQFLAKKYDLAHKQMNVAQWKFLRLRPANFPTIRLAQFASLLCSHTNIFSGMIEASSYQQLAHFFEINQSTYWKIHYRFGKKSKGEVPGFGESSKENIIINTVVPLFVAYGQSRDDYSFVEKAIAILQSIPSEKNRITRVWQELGYVSKTAFDSQGLIELYNNFCQRRACLNCTIGSALLKPNLVK
ncbi:MAG: DUF2851 family protein [Cyclobacteriaceae bacterium]|nr:DUF2851 family protein [Cyclobacteriaceae bacterium]